MAYIMPSAGSCPEISEWWPKTEHQPMCVGSLMNESITFYKNSSGQFLQVLVAF